MSEFKKEDEDIINSDADVVIVGSPYLGDPETINEVFELHNRVEDIIKLSLPTKQEIKQEKMNRINRRRRR